MIKLTDYLYVNEKDVIEDKLKEFKKSIESKILIKQDIWSQKVNFKWEEDKVKYSYTDEGWCMDYDEFVQKEYFLEKDEKDMLNSFNKIIKYLQDEK